MTPDTVIIPTELAAEVESRLRFVEDAILADRVAAAIRALAPAPPASEDRNEEPSALVTVGEPNGGDHEHGRVTGQAGASVPAAQPATEGLVEAAQLAVMYLRTGFIACPQCGHEVPTEHTDAEYALNDALTAQPASEDADHEPA